ncbi:MAG: hypothetical protein WB767_02950 [Nocardioides sp.]
MAQHRHKRDANARRKHRGLLIAAPLAILATASAVTIGVADADLSNGAPTQAARTSTPLASAIDRAAAAEVVAGADAKERGFAVSRGAVGRAPAKATRRVSKVDRLMNPKQKWRAIAGAEVKRWTAEDLNLWTEPGKKARKTDELVAGQIVLLTGRSLYGRDEIVWGRKQTRWVTSGYLTTEKPFALGGDCSNGTSVPSAVSENIKKVHAAVCAAFPDISGYGTFRSDGEHSQGIAVDIMISGSEGYRVADFVREYYAELGVSYVIYAQRIWSVERGGEGWRAMSDRGSSTANHYDHVHVTTF